MADSNSNSVIYDAVVIGAGVMGSATAYNLAKSGLNTLLLEQFDFLHHRGSSHGESRTIRATYPETYYSAMVKLSAQLWTQAEAEIGYKVYFPSTHLDVGPPDSKSLVAVISNCVRLGTTHQVLQSCEVAERFSGRFHVPDDWIGLVTELGGVIKPTKAVAMFQALALKNGAALKDNVEVIEIKRVGELLEIFTTNGERFKARKCVVTAGAWMKKLVKAVAGVELPIQPLECSVCYWKIKDGKEKEFSIDAGKFPTFASYGDPYVYGTPALEYPGLIKVAVHNGKVCDPDRREWGNDLLLQKLLKKWIEERFQGLVDSTEPVCTQSCMYSMTPDEDYVMDFVGGEFGQDLVIGGGFSGHGFKMAPLVGRALADLVMGGAVDGVEMEHFRIGRFEGGLKGNVKEVEDQVCFNKFN